MPSKLPWMQFYPADWTRDTAALSLSARGAWITLICSMWGAKPRGKLTMSMAAYGRLLGVTATRATAVIAELSKLLVCNSVTNGNGDVTLVCRRQVNEEKQRESTRYRVKKYRNAHVTPMGNVSVTPYISEVISQKSESEKNKKIKPVFEIPVKLNTPEFLKAWEDWKTHRKEIKKPLTVKSIEMQMKDFEMWGIIRAIAAIEHTIKKGWQGIREPDGKTPGSAASTLATRKPFPGEVLKLLTELRSQKEAMWNRYSFNGEIPADKPTVRAEYTELVRRVKELEHQARTI